MIVTKVHKGQKDQVKGNSARTIIRRLHDATEGHAARGGVKPWLLTRVLMFLVLRGTVQVFPSHFGFFNRYTENPKSNRLSSLR